MLCPANYSLLALIEPTYRYYIRRKSLAVNINVIFLYFTYMCCYTMEIIGGGGGGGFRRPYSTVQYSTVQYSTVQYSTVQYKKMRARHLKFIQFYRECIWQFFISLLLLI